MKLKDAQSKRNRAANFIDFNRLPASLRLCVFIFLLSFLAACSELKKPKTEPFYAENPKPPAKQEFRWSNGKMPKSFDPALAAASPEADFARAMYEGLTDTDSKTLQPVAALAVSWTPSEDFKTWTFQLRKDAKWSNGEIVTAKDFVRSWKRLVELGDKVQQRALLKNIVGMDTENVLPVFADEEIDAAYAENTNSEFLNNQKTGESKENKGENTNAAAGGSKPETTPQTVKTPDKAGAEQTSQPKKETREKEPFGVEAVDDFTLKVSLTQPDRNFAALVAHPIFRPVYDGGREFENAGNALHANVTTNGAFRLAAVKPDGIVLERAANYWNAGETKLETVRFVPAENAENALAAYRAGEVDAVTNADFKPLALKLLAPYDDFRRTPHAALNFYEFNTEKTHLADARVRRALATAIERERLTEDEMDGASLPALGFLPFTEGEKIKQDAAAAQKLLAEAGYPEGRNFPVVRLVINRNDMQRRIARAVAKMWKKNLNIETEVVVKEQSDFEAAYQNRDYDIIRRGVVLPTPDETANMLALFPPVPELEKEEEITENSDSGSVSTDRILSDKSAESNLDLTRLRGEENAAANTSSGEQKHENSNSGAAATTASNAPAVKQEEPLLTERQALENLPAIPLYFPTSYSLVKPYVRGFEMNVLDAPSLKNVEINHNWQPSNQKILSKDQK